LGRTPEKGGGREIFRARFYPEAVLGAALAAVVVLHVGGFHDPRAVAVDPRGNVFVADTGACRVVELPAGVPHPHPRTVAGGSCRHSAVGFPGAVAVDAQGDLFVADTAGGRVLERRGGHLATVANGLSGPTGLAVDAQGDLFIADTDHCRVLRRSAGSTLPTVIAGTGTCGYSGDGGAATSAELRLPGALAVDATGDLFIADRGNDVVREVSGGRITTVAGMGTYGFYLGNGLSATGPLAALNEISGLAVDAHGDLFISDAQSGAVREMTARTGMLSTVPLPAAVSPAGLSAARTDELVVADAGSGVVTAIRTKANGTE
jgi:sugar lactone lactonase YvrE